MPGGSSSSEAQHRQTSSAVMIYDIQYWSACPRPLVWCTHFLLPHQPFSFTWGFQRPLDSNHRWSAIIRAANGTVLSILLGSLAGLLQERLPHYLAVKKEWGADVCCPVEEPWKGYVRWKKLVMYCPFPLTQNVQKRQTQRDRVQLR